MSMKRLVLVSIPLFMALCTLPASAQSQADINNLQALIPWAEKLDQQRAEQREREAQQAQQKWATIEQANREREELAANLLAQRTARAKAIKTWNPKAYPAPPLFPGESLVYTLNGCGLVLPMPADDLFDYPDGYDREAKKAITKRMTHRAYYGAMQWEGDCIYGLAEGLGTLAEPKNMVNFMSFQSGYFRGRSMNFYLFESPANGMGQYEVTMGQDRGGAKQISQLVRDDPYAGLWSGQLSNAPRTSLRIQEQGKESYISTDTNDCTTFEVLYSKKIKGCSYNNDFPVYSIVQGVGYFDQNPKITFCPNMKTSAGCEALWNQLAAPMIAKLKADWEAANANLQKERARIENLSSAWYAGLQKAEKTKQRAQLAPIEKLFKANPKSLNDNQLESLWSSYGSDTPAADLSKLYSAKQSRFQQAKNQAMAQKQQAETTMKPDEGVSQNEIDACSREIMGKQVESQSWSGDVNDIAARLGRYQKELFEGRCANHPEAQAYINSANRMLGYQAAAGSSSSASSANRSGGSARRTRQSHVPGAVATPCLAIKPDGGVNNNCNFAIEYIYCVSKPTPGSWSATFDCAQGKSGSWQIGALSTAIMHTSGERVQYFGCKYGPTLGKPDGVSPADFRYSPSATGMPTGRCKEWGAP